jgi:8-amino-7-oxononanoate synthase/dethiobiotin synthetase
MTKDGALPRILLITGTDTDVGKTIATAALAATLATRGRTVAVYKPVQAGTYDGGGDIDVVGRLAGTSDVHEGIRLAYPMAPVAAARRSGVALPPIKAHVRAVERLADTHNHTLVEGAGGLLVHLDGQRHTLADLAAGCAQPTATVLVCRAGLGTLNHTELTLEALNRRGIPVLGVLIGSWPQRPSEIDESNRAYLAALPVALLGAIPERAAALEPAAFRAQAASWIPGLPRQDAATSP